MAAEDIETKTEEVEKKEGEEGAEGEEGGDKKRRRRERKRRERPAEGEPKKYKQIDIDCLTSNSKTEVGSYVQIKTGVAMKKDDIKYKTEKQDDGKWISTVEIVVMENITTTGEPQETQKEAEKSAALCFLQERRDEIEEMNKDARPIELDLKTTADEEELDENGQPKVKSGGNKTPKELLQNFACKTSTRQIKAGDLMYTAEKVDGGYKATLQILVLPEPWNEKVWEGEVRETDIAAEHQVATVCYQEIKDTIPVNPKKEREPGTERGGRGGRGGAGRGGDGEKKDGKKWLPPPEMMAMMMMMSMGKGKGKGKAAGGAKGKGWW